jgi:hypothetical protein
VGLVNFRVFYGIFVYHKVQYKVQFSLDFTWVCTKTKYFFGKSRGDVKSKMRIFRREAEKYGYIGSQKLCVRDFMDEWLYGI